MELNSFVCLIADVASKIAYLYFISLRADTPLGDTAGSLIHSVIRTTDNGLGTHHLRSDKSGLNHADS